MSSSEESDRGLVRLRVIAAVTAAGLGVPLTAYTFALAGVIAAIGTVVIGVPVLVLGAVVVAGRDAA